MSTKTSRGAVTLNWSTGLTIAVTFGLLGLTMQVALAQAGMSPLRSWIASAAIFSATSQFAYLTVRAADGAEAAAIVAGVIVATRFGILTASLIPRLPPSRWRRAVAAVCTFDPAVAIAVQQPGPERTQRQFWLTTSCLLGGWFAGITIGSVLGDVVGDTARFGLDAVFPALLLAVLGNSLRSRDGLTAAVCGGLIGIVLVPVVPAGVPIILSLAGVAIALSLASGEQRA